MGNIYLEYVLLSATMASYTYETNNEESQPEQTSMYLLSQCCNSAWKTLL